MSQQQITELLDSIALLKEENARLKSAAAPVAKRTVSVLIVTGIGSELEEEMNALIGGNPAFAGVQIDFIRHTQAELAPGGPAHEVLTSAEVMLCSPGPVLPLMDHAKSLKWMQATWAGVNALVSVLNCFINTRFHDLLCTLGKPDASVRQNNEA